MNYKQGIVIVPRCLSLYPYLPWPCTWDSIFAPYDTWLRHRCVTTWPILPCYRDMFDAFRYVTFYKNWWFKETEQTAKICSCPCFHLRRNHFNLVHRLAMLAKMNCILWSCKAPGQTRARVDESWRELKLLRVDLGEWLRVGQTRARFDESLSRISRAKKGEPRNYPGKSLSDVNRATSQTVYLGSQTG